MPVIAKTIQPSPNLDALWQEGLLCRRRCAWCKKFMGYKSWDGTPGMTTDGICPECQEKLFADAELEKFDRED